MSFVRLDYHDGRLLGSKMTTLGVFLKDTATRYRIGSQTTVLQPFNY